jgi:predicted AlkP superfamily phosphohydrolase/phosphomutase
MFERPTKVMVLGVDGPIVPRLRKWAAEGKLPTFQKLIDQGVFAPNCLVPFPTITPPNWTTITTGAWPGTHGITCFRLHKPGTPLDKLYKAFNTHDVQSERVWTALERKGKRTIVVNYPSTWPPTVGDGCQISGQGLAVNDWRYGDNIEPLSGKVNLAHDFMLTTEPYPFATQVSFRKAGGWNGLQHSPRALDAEVTLSLFFALNELLPIKWYLLVDDSVGNGYDTVLISRSKNAEDVFARLKVGEWTPNIYETFETFEGPKKGVFRAKLVELSDDACEFRLYVPGLCSLEDWAYPKALEQEFVCEEGLPLGRHGYEPFMMGWIDGDTLVETIEFSHRWLADVCRYLATNKPWDLFFMHVHTPDWVYHTFSSELDPITAPDMETALRMEGIERALYEGVDRLFGRIVEVLDDNTLIVVVSDHGCVAFGTPFKVNDVLSAAGLLHYGEAKGTGAPPIDWTRTRAVGQRYTNVYVNLKGRDPDGIVEPGEEYEEVVEQVLKALKEYVDPQTGRKPIAMALRKEDARVLGLYGDRVGDVIFAIDPSFGAEHGNQLTTAHWGVGDMHGLFIMAGPGVRKGETLDRTVWLTDLVPTICHLAELPVPKDCEGAILYQALENPDAKMKELRSLRANVARYEKLVQRPPNL